MTNAARTPSVAPLRVQARRQTDGVIVIRCVGQLRQHDAGYLPDLAKLLEAQPDKARIVFDAVTLESYSVDFPLAHIPFFNTHRAKIERVAVAHELRSIAFAIATVALASQTQIKGFPSLAEAFEWVRAR